MKRLLLLVIGTAFLLAAEPGIAADKNRNLTVDSDRGARVALVIGNAAYPGVAALRNPANDASDMAAKLGRLGFDVTLKVNVGLKEMLRALTAFGDKVRPGSEVLVFYAGHGMQVRGRNYLIPVDAEIGNETAVSSEAVDVDQLLDKLANARLSMVILDACRNNPFERRFRGYGQGLAQINAPTGTLIAYSTAPGKVASDGDGRNGLYTQELLAALDVPGIRVEDVFKRVRVNVVRKSRDAQTPWESSSLTGDFYFSGVGGETVPGALPLPAPEATISPTSRIGEAEQATIYFFRSAGFVGSSVVFNISQDRRQLGQLANGSYFEFKSPAGKHTFSAIPSHAPDDVSASATYEIVAGRTYYIEYEMQWGIGSFKLISEDLGKEQLGSLRQTALPVTQ